MLRVNAQGYVGCDCILAEAGLLGHYLLILFDVVNCRISNANANRVCFFFALAILDGLGAGGIGGLIPAAFLLGRLRRFAVFRCVTLLTTE